MANPETKKKEEEKDKKERSTLDLWEQYNNFVRSMHFGKNSKEKNKRDWVINFLKKILIIFFGAAFTTFAFYFFIEPNNLHNSGLNGIFQLIAKLFIGKNDLPWGLFRWIYHGLSLLFNTGLIFILWYFFDADFEIIGTAIPYIVCQFFWSFIFDKFNFIFVSFSPSSWKKFIGTGTEDFALALPYYIVLALAAALIHSIGYGIITRALATPGGHDLIINHLRQKKKKLPFGKISKIFSFSAILFVILTSIFTIDDDPKMKASFFKRDWNLAEQINSQNLSFEEAKEKFLRDFLLFEKEERKLIQELEKVSDEFNEVNKEYQKKEKEKKQIIGEETIDDTVADIANITASNITQNIEGLKKGKELKKLGKEKKDLEEKIKGLEEKRNKWYEENESFIMFIEKKIISLTLEELKGEEIIGHIHEYPQEIKYCTLERKELLNALKKELTEKELTEKEEKDKKKKKKEYMKYMKKKSKELNY